jgi:hypothetical protein
MGSRPCHPQTPANHRVGLLSTIHRATPLHDLQHYRRGLRGAPPCEIPCEIRFGIRCGIRVRNHHVESPSGITAWDCRVGPPDKPVDPRSPPGSLANLQFPAWAEGPFQGSRRKFGAPSPTSVAGPAAKGAWTHAAGVSMWPCHQSYAGPLARVCVLTLAAEVRRAIAQCAWARAAKPRSPQCGGASVG